MPPLRKIEKRDILSAALQIIRECGIASLNARSIAVQIGCSTQPIYSAYKNMAELKADVYSEICGIYNSFIEKEIDKSDYLFSISLAYEEFARTESRLFDAMFMSELGIIRTVDEVINSDWNRETIEAIVKEYAVSLKRAEGIYRDTRFYTHGISTQVSSKSISLTKEDAGKLIRNIINILVK